MLLGSEKLNPQSTPTLTLGSHRTVYMYICTYMYVAHHTCMHIKVHVDTPCLRQNPIKRCTRVFSDALEALVSRTTCMILQNDRQ